MIVWNDDGDVDLVRTVDQQEIFYDDDVVEPNRFGAVVAVILSLLFWLAIYVVARAIALF